MRLFTYQSDITVIPIPALDAYVRRQVLRMSEEREQAIRSLARPFLAAGYLPDELTVVERQSDLLQPGSFVCVKVRKPRSAFRLWWRRVMWSVGFFPEGTAWRG